MADFTTPTQASTPEVDAIRRALIYRPASPDPMIYRDQPAQQAAAQMPSADDVVRGELEAQLAQAKEALAQREAMNAAQAQKLTDLGKKPDDYQRGAYMAMLGLDTEGKAPKSDVKPMPSDIRRRLLDTKAGLEQMNQLEAELVQPETQSLMGPIESRLMIAPNALGLTPKRAQVIALIDQTRQVVGKAMEGGVLRKEDEIKYKRILPTVNDTPEVALAKIAQVRQMLNQAYADAYEAGSGAGYNPGGYIDPSDTEAIRNALIDSGEIELEF